VAVTSVVRALERRVRNLLAARALRVNRASLQVSGVFARERLSETLWDCTIGGNGELMVGGVSVVDLAERFGTPLHVVHTDRLRRNHRDFVGAFADARAHVRLGTSYKTNPVPYVLRTLHDCGSLAEVITHFELWLALHLGVPSDRILFNGPGKSRESLELAVERGVGLINVDSYEELMEVETICARRGRRQRIGLRLTTSVGWESQFGFGIGSGAAFGGYRAAAEAGHLDPVGVHLHLGTGLNSAATYVRGITECLELARKVNHELGVMLGVLDLGGGFGVPTTRARGAWANTLEELGSPIEAALPGSALTPADYAREIVPLVNRYFDDVRHPNPELIFEPGRAITASCQLLLLRVLRVKERGRPTPEVILDGGRNLTMPLSWEFHEVHPANKMHVDALRPQNLYGPLCHPYDIIALNKSLPRLETGDVVAVMDAGAYFIPNQMNFSNPRPGIVAVEEGSARVVRMPESFEDVVRHDERI